MTNHQELHLFGGEKGGVGKSLVCRTVVQYLLDQGQPFRLFETDRSNPDVKRIYGDLTDCKFGIFSEAEKYEDTANQIFNTALEHRVLVNLPAQVLPALRQWFQANEIFELAAENGVALNIWFISDGGYDSLNLLEKSLEFFTDRARHIVVKNYGKTEDWEAFEQNRTLQKLLKKYPVTEIDFPKFLGSVVRNTVDEQSLPFGKALEYEGFSLIERQRVRKFLREAYAAIEQAKVLA